MQDLLIVRVGVASLAVLVLGSCAQGLRALPKDTATDTDTGNSPSTQWTNPSTQTSTGDNDAPWADAGLDAEGILSDVIQLDGTGSSDPDGDPLSYTWDFVSMPANSATYLINDTREDPSFYADADGTFEIRLTVSDGLLSADDTVTVTITAPNDLPYADAGPDQSVTTGDVVQLNGSNSWDPDGDALNFTWSLTMSPTGSGAALSDVTSPLPTFVADLAGRYEASLIVDDGVSSSASDIVAVTASEPSDDGCLSTYATGARSQWGRGGLSGGHALALLPFFALLWFRREDL